MSSPYDEEDKELVKFNKLQQRFPKMADDLYHPFPKSNLQKYQLYAIFKIPTSENGR